MDKRLYIEDSLGQTRVALLEDGELVELHVEGRDAARKVGNVYLGRVQSVLPGMQAAFVDIGEERNAFLHVGDIASGLREDELDEQPTKKPSVPTSIREVAKVGQELLVQIIKEADGTKGARVSTRVVLPGRLLVLLTDMGYVGVSRRITNESRRAELRKQVEALCDGSLGAIVRTAAQDAEPGELEKELLGLIQTWNEIRRRATTEMAPRRIHGEDDLLSRSLRDWLSPEVSKVTVQGEYAFTRALALTKQYAPALVGRVAQHKGALPLFDVARLEPMAEKALARRVWLKSGGYIVIDQTEALTVIDVNTGRYVGEKDQQQTVYATNTQAAREIARQVRLRDLGGIIIIDFIDMVSPEHQTGTLETLKEALLQDRNKTNVADMTSLGLVELTRRKVRQRLSSAMECTCPLCGGTGRVLKDDQVARVALREAIRRQASGDERVTIVAKPHVAAALKKLELGLGFGLLVEENMEGDHYLTISSEQTFAELVKV